jgi:Ferritin-like domain
MHDEQLFGGGPAIRFAAERDRRTFLKWAAIVGAGGTLGLALRDGFGSARASNPDVDILNYILTLEYLEADFYRRGLDANVLSGRDLELVEPIEAHERQHVALISSTIQDLGADPVEKPQLRYPSGTFSGRDKFLRTGHRLETLQVKAYYGQVTYVRNSKLLGAAASIAGTESRHVAILADLTGINPFPAPLEEAGSKRKVLRAARPFIKG